MTGSESPRSTTYPGQAESLRPGWQYVSGIDGYYRLPISPTRWAEVWFNSVDSLWRWRVFESNPTGYEVLASFTTPLDTADAAMREAGEFAKEVGDR